MSRQLVQLVREELERWWMRPQLLRAAADALEDALRREARLIYDLERLVAVLEKAQAREEKTQFYLQAALNREERLRAELEELSSPPKEPDPWFER